MKKTIVTKVVLFVLANIIIAQSLPVVNSQIPTGYNNTPPDPPELWGPVTCTVFKEYTYNITISDPDGNRLAAIELQFGDGTNETLRYQSKSSCNKGWRSGITLTFTHRWRKTGDLSIKARVQDVLATWGEWGEMFVSISCNTVLNHKINNIQQVDSFVDSIDTFLFFLLLYYRDIKYQCEVSRFNLVNQYFYKK